MSYTKRQLIEMAYEEIGYASYVYDLQPEQLESALRRLDGMMALWNAKGLRLGYPLPSSPQDSDLDEESGIPDSANMAVYQNLAVALAPTVGKTVAVETAAMAKLGYNTLLGRAAMPPEMQLPNTMPAGAGNKTYDTPFVLPPSDPVQAGPDGLIDLY
jgi:hypothetical protein